MEKILSIKEVEGIKPEGADNYESFAGFEIETNKQKILLLIGDDQTCCEHWGYFMSQDDFTEFVGAEIKEIKITDESLNTTLLKKEVGENCWDYEDPSLMFVTLETDKGTLQFTAYNVHNGYYSHKALVQSQQLTHEEYL